MIYDLSERGIKNKELLKKSLLITRAFIKKLLKEFIKILFILIILVLKTFIEKLLKEFKKTFNAINFIL